MTPKELYEKYIQTWDKFVELYNSPGQLANEHIGYSILVGIAYLFWLFIVLGFLKLFIQAITQKYTVTETSNAIPWYQEQEFVIYAVHYSRDSAEKTCRKALRREVQKIIDLNPKLRAEGILEVWRKEGRSFRIMDDLAFNPDAVVLDLLNLRDCKLDCRSSAHSKISGFED